VPGCIGIGTWGKDYCYDPNWESPGGPPTSKPTYAPNSYGATFVPGDLSVPCEGLMLSKGMACRKLTTADMPVQFDTGGQSTDLMHKRADAAVVIAHPNDGGWYYVSNSETSASNGGGVGTLRFNAAGQVIGYKRDLYGTSYNCGGGECRSVVVVVSPYMRNIGDIFIFLTDENNLLCVSFHSIRRENLLGHVC
jgi:hypothetical protein